MKLIGNLKKRVDQATDIAEKKSLIEKAGMQLTDDEMEQVAGGANFFSYEKNCPFCEKIAKVKMGESCPRCGWTYNP